MIPPRGAGKGIPGDEEVLQDGSISEKVTVAFLVMRSGFAVAGQSDRVRNRYSDQRIE